MNTIKEIKRLDIDVVSAIVLVCFNTKADWLLPGMADMINIPIKGINNNEKSIIYYKNNKLCTYLGVHCLPILNKHNYII